MMKNKMNPVVFITKNINNSTNLLLRLQEIVRQQIKLLSYKYQSYSLGLDVYQLLDSDLYVNSDMNLLNMNRIAILGEHGTGKTLLLLKLYISKANDFLRKTTFDSLNDIIPIIIFAEDVNVSSHTGSIYDVLQHVGLSSDLANLNYSIFFDGIDEITVNCNKILDKNFIGRISYFTCRTNNYNKFDVNFLNYYMYNIKKWSLQEVEVFAEKYLIAQNYDRQSIDKILNIINKEDSIKCSPLLLTLFLNSVCMDKEWNDYLQYSCSIIEKSLKICLKKEIRDKNLTINIDDAFAIVENANWCYCNDKEKEIKTIRDMINIIYLKFGKKINKKNINCILSLFFIQDEYSQKNLRIHMHKRISEFLSAKHIYNIIINNVQEYELLDKFHMTFVSMDLLIEMIKIEPQKSEIWINNGLLRITKPYDTLFGICIFLLCKVFYNKKIEQELINSLASLPNYQKLIIYDQLIQHSSNYNVKYCLEEEYYKFLISNNDIQKLDVGIRLYYVGAINNFNDYLLDNETYTIEDVQILIEKYNQHFSEGNINDKHYILRRIELLTLNYIAQEHVNDAFANIITNFVINNEERIEMKSFRNEFDEKVYDCFKKLTDSINYFAE